ncbi:DNA translocase FtsK [hydrothermal vent metagenome]|uniref:DNA translocase FtsK n=1 Tax=hydrothermal vent metagenome TaxID=652676 RepID=A0A3B1CB49_9ZZZZ
MESSKAKITLEVIGVCLIATAVFTAISLFSYHSSDPSLNSYLSKPVAVKNQAGIIGASLSDLSVQTAGAAAGLIPAGLLYIGVLLCSKPSIWSLASFIGGFSILMAAVSAWANVYWGADPLFSGAVAGGVFGKYVAENLMVRWFSVYGSYVILTALTLSSILLITRMSLSRAFEKINIIAHKSLVLISRFGLWLWKTFSNLVLRMVSMVVKIRIPIFMETVEERKIKEKKEKIRLKQKGDYPVDNETVTGEEDEGLFIPGEPVIINMDTDNLPPLPPGRRDSKDVEGSLDGFAGQESLNFGDGGQYIYPPLKLLDAESNTVSRQTREELIKRSMILEKKLRDFGVEGKVSQVLPGPVVTVYEFEPAPGIKVSRVVGLADDLAMVLRATSIRILAPVPGKSVVGIEVPNVVREMVFLKEILSSDEFKNSESRLTMALGKDVSGASMVADLSQVPHLLIAGSTGAGKSVGINSMISSILYKATPADVKFIMIDPKMLELSIYEGIPHLIAPVVTNPKKAANALRWAVEEMERRYKKLSKLGVRNIDGYNKLVKSQMEQAAMKGRGPIKVSEWKEDGMEAKEETLEKLPYIVVVIDELADLMMVAAKEVEDALARLAQMARASGIHLIVATQRPSVDVLTGLIKANFPARISFQVRSRIDSRTILDSMGADKLLGKGDMLYLPPGTSKLVRIHGSFVSDTEIHRVVGFLKDQQKPVYDEEILKPIDEGIEGGGYDEEADEFYDQALELVAKTRQASISMIQRRFRIGYNRAARIVEMMERQGLVGPADGLKPREVFIKELDDVETVN